MIVKAGRKQLRLKVSEELGGILVPGALQEDGASVPLDFTSISGREVGRQHSNWCVRHAHLLYSMGNLRSALGNYKYDLKNAEAAWMQSHLGDHKFKWEADYAMGSDKNIRRMRRKINQAESRLAIFEALSESYKALREAASREMTRRASETVSRHDT